MGTVIREIEGKKHVPAHAHEAGAIEHDGDWWRVLPPPPPPCHWCGSTEGYALAYDGNERCLECQGC